MARILNTRATRTDFGYEMKGSGVNCRIMPLSSGSHFCPNRGTNEAFRWMVEAYGMHVPGWAFTTYFFTVKEAKIHAAQMIAEYGVI